MVLYNLLSILVLISIFFSGSTGNVISPESRKIYHDINAGLGLYSQFNKVTNLNVTTFRQRVFNSSENNSWLIEFYNSWCGHCHRFSSVWKQLAIDIHGWKDVIKIAAVDCSNSLNTPLCRDFEVMYYPMVKYFPPLPANDFLGTPVKAGSVERLINTTLNILRQDALEGTVNQPALLPFTGQSLSDIWNKAGSNIDYMVVVFQKNDTFLGEALSLDFLRIPNVKVNIVFDSNNGLVREFSVSKYPSIYLVDRRNISPIISANDSRFSVYGKLEEQLLSRGISIPKMIRETVPTDTVIDVSQVMAMMEVEDQIKNKLKLNAINDVVFQVDIEGAVRNSLRVEIPRSKSISGEPLEALKLYLKTLVEFFPIGKKGMDYLQSIYDEVKDKSIVSGSDFMKIVSSKEERFEPYFAPDSGWLGCHGSQPRFRGYPCSLWTLFHTLTVQADQAREPDGKKVLRAMLGYIKNFFGCTDCSQHFQEMAVTFDGNVTSTNDSILWLWKAHNSVNKRLKGDATEDPRHPKVQFPSPTLCRACQTNTGHWNEQVVLAFLKSMYQNISYFRIDDLPPQSSTTEKPILSNMLVHENIVEEKNYSQTDNKQVLFHFNLFDASLFIILYIISMGIIIVVCAKFLLKRSYRKKAYAFDIFQKV